MTTTTDTRTREAKHTAKIDRGSTIRMPVDRKGSPRISFAYTTDGMLVLLEGNQILGKEDLSVEKAAQPVTLRYTVAEWDAFIKGVRDGEFDEYASEPSSDLIPTRDSKDPAGPILVFTVDQMRPFFEAIKAGKYDI